MSRRTQQATTAPHHAATRRGNTTAFPTVIKSALCALPLTAGVGSLLLLSATLLLLKAKDPAGHHAAVAIAIVCLTAVVGGAAAARFHKRRVPVLCGLAEALLLLLLTLPAPLLLPAAWQHARPLAVNIGLHAALFPLCVAGALLASRQPEKKRKRH